MKQINLDASCLPYFAELGRQGENGVRKLIFDCSAFQREAGAGTAVILHQRSADDVPYLADTVQNESCVEWLIGSDDTAFVGCGKAQLNWYVGDTLAKTSIFSTRVLASLSDYGDATAHTKSALDLIGELITRTGGVVNTGRTPLDLSDETDENYTEDGYDITGLADGAYDITGAGTIINPDGELTGAKLDVSEGSLLLYVDGSIALVCDNGIFYFHVTEDNWENYSGPRYSDLLVNDYPSRAVHVYALEDGLYYGSNAVTYKNTVDNNTYSVSGFVQVKDCVHYAYDLGLKFTVTGKTTLLIKVSNVEPIYNAYTKTEVDNLISSAIADVSALIGGASS